MKNPADLTGQKTQLATIRRKRGSIWRAYEMKEQFRTIFNSGIEPADAVVMLDRWPLIINAIEQDISNGTVEGMNVKVRLIIRRAYGFHSADAALVLACGPINLVLPHERATRQAAA